MNISARTTEPTPGSAPRVRWLNRTVLGIGLASLLSDWAHEIATAVLPAYLATLGVAAAWLGLIEGVADGASSFAKMASGYYTDRLRRRKPIAVAGYVVTAVGTASFGLATSAWHLLVARTLAWLGRGVRTPVRKALLASAVTPETYGRAFGFERMMDTLGAIAGPATALGLLAVTGHHYPSVFAWSLVPGLLAALCIAVLVMEKERRAIPRLSLAASLHALPPRFRPFILAVALFGAGDFAHSLLILLAAQRLAETYGPERAATLAVMLYIMRNLLYAGFSMVAGWLADRFSKPRVLAAGYGLAACMAAGLVFLPISLWTLAGLFILAGIYIAIEETLEDSLCAELVPEAQHGMAFGTLATVNGVGDLVSSLVVGALWTAWGTQVAFGYSAILFLAGALLATRVGRPSSSAR